MAAVTYPTLEDVAMEARPYPAHLLEVCETGLVLFAAAFLGHNDAIHFAEAGLTTTCVDVDGARLNEMRGLYPAGWEFVERDAWEYATECRDAGLYRWDAVSCDTFTGEATERSLASLDLWCSLARKVVTATITRSDVGLLLADQLTRPPGWHADLFERSDTVYWLVLTR